MISCLLLCGVLIGLPVELLNQSRAACREAVEELEQVEADLRLLDVLLGEAWAHHLSVDGTLLGLPDAQRREMAMAILDEAVTVSDRLDLTLQHMAASGQPVTLASARWQMRRGVACAAYGLLHEDYIKLRESADLLSDALADGADATGRLRRLLVSVHQALGEDAAALSLLKASHLVSDPVEQTAMEILQWGLSRDREWSAAPVAQLSQAGASWQVQLIAEAGLAQSRTSAHASAIADAWLQRLRRDEATSPSPESVVRATATRMSTQSWDVSLDTSSPLVAGWMDALVASGQAAAALLMAEAARVEDRGDREKVVLLDARASARKAVGDSAGAVQDWLRAASMGLIQQRARLLDKAAIVAIEERDLDAALVDLVLARASAHGESPGQWILRRAHRAVEQGQNQTALELLAEVLPRSPSHVNALQLNLYLLEERLRLGQMSEADADRLDEVRAKGLIAHRRGRRGAAAVAAGAAMLRIEKHLVDGDLDQARALRTDDKAVLIGTPACVALVDAKILALSSDHSTLAKHAETLGAAQARELLVWLESHQPAFCSVVAATMSSADGGGDVEEDLQLASALSRSGRRDEALVVYNSILSRRPNLPAAILGRCECLWTSSDREALADLARDYRRLASLPRTDNPARWRLVNERLLAVLLRAGAPINQIAAKCARLQAIDPRLKCPDATGAE
ncbi:MAG: hypothetical protein MK077_06705 [Phycisphaerales bacterium]|nr:hypothetical protein [Phycisphaerales bacterium]